MGHKHIQIVEHIFKSIGIGDKWYFDVVRSINYVVRGLTIKCGMRI